MQMIVSSIGARQDTSTEDTIVVSTPLDAIAQLEGREVIASIILAGTYATDHALAAFLAESYPTVRVEQEG
jgi:hypothetical protein